MDHVINIKKYYAMQSKYIKYSTMFCKVVRYKPVHPLMLNRTPHVKQIRVSY